MVQILTPNYQLLAEAYKTDPVAAGLDAYTKMQANRRAQQATQLAQRLGNIQAQTAQTKLQYLPKQEELATQKQTLANQANQLAYNSARHNYVVSRLGEVGALDPTQQKEGYQQVRKEGIAMGADPNFLPQEYNARAQQLIHHALNIAPPTPATKFKQQIQLARIKNLGTLQAAQARGATTIQAAKIRAAATTQKETTLQKAQATQVVKDAATINDAANEAQQKAIPLWHEINQQLDKTIVGPGVGRIDWKSPAANRLNQLLMQAQGLKIKSFHLGRMTQYEFNIIRKMVGTPSMYRSVLKKVIRKHLRDAQEAIENQKFSNKYIKGGGYNPTEMSTLWNNEVARRRQADIEFTAKQNNMTINQVKELMGYNL